MKYITIRIPIPHVDLRILVWLYASAAVRALEWHMSHMDHHRPPPDEWARRVQQCNRLRSLRDAQFPQEKAPRTAP